MNYSYKETSKSYKEVIYSYKQMNYACTEVSFTHTMDKSYEGNEFFVHEITHTCRNNCFVQTMPKIRGRNLWVRVRKFVGKGRWSVLWVSRAQVATATKSHDLAACIGHTMRHVIFPCVGTDTHFNSFIGIYLPRTAMSQLNCPKIIPYQ